MSDYKRLVAYIYLYDNGIRAKNIGFTKVEAKEGRLRIFIHVKGVHAAEGQTCDAYMFYRSRDELKGISIGSFSITGGSGELKVLTDVGNVAESGRPFAGMAGIIMKTSGGRLLATRWDDEPLDPEKFTVHDNQESVDAVRSQEIWAEEQDLPENFEETEAVSEPEPAFRTADPADLLAYGTWGRRLVNNSFLLHGYYNYGHLLFGREDEREFLGVPGDFCVQEKMMAALFGFPEFQTVDTYERDTGNTGYWLRRLEYGPAGKIYESSDRTGPQGL